MRKKAIVNKDLCVACGACAKVCPKDAMSVFKGIYAVCNTDNCVGCGMCVRTCPANALTLVAREEVSANEK